MRERRYEQRLVDDAFALQRLALGEDRRWVVRVEEVDYRVEATRGIAAHHGCQEVDQAAITPRGHADKPRIIREHAVGDERVVGLAKREQLGAQLLANAALERAE